MSAAKEVTLIHYLMRLVNSQAGMQTKQAFNVVLSSLFGVCVGSWDT